MPRETLPPPREFSPITQFSVGSGFTSLVDIEIPFWRMVMIFFKAFWALLVAAILIGIILFIPVKVITSAMSY